MHRDNRGVIMARTVTVSHHAAQRWVERVRGRLVDIQEAFNFSRKLSTKQARTAGIQVLPHRRYYQHPICYFVVDNRTDVIITILPRLR